MSDDDIERLASRLAMVVSEDGEAENAGRAMGQLARRLGLTGGELKEIFVAGASVAGTTAYQARHNGEAERLAAEIATLRHSLRLLEASGRNVEYERDALQREVSALRGLLARRQTKSRVPLAVGLAVLLAVGVAGAASYLMPPSGPAVALTAVPAAQDAGRRVAVVRNAGTVVYQQPDRGAPVLATLPAGMPVVVHRLLWNMMMQWAEVDIGSGTGYVLTTDIDLS